MDLDAVDVDAGAARRLGVAADRVDVAAEAACARARSPRTAGRSPTSRNTYGIPRSSLATQTTAPSASARKPTRSADRARAGRARGSALRRTRTSFSWMPAKISTATSQRIHEVASGRKSLARPIRKSSWRITVPRLPIKQQHHPVPGDQPGQRDHERGDPDLGDDQPVEGADRDARAERERHGYRRGAPRCRPGSAARRRSRRPRPTRSPPTGRSRPAAARRRCPSRSS